MAADPEELSLRPVFVESTEAEVGTSWFADVTASLRSCFPRESALPGPLDARPLAREQAGSIRWFSAGPVCGRQPRPRGPAT